MSRDQRTSQRLTDARPSALDPTPDPARRERDLARAFAEPPPSSTRIRRPRLRLIPVTGMLGAVAALVATAVIVAPGQQDAGTPTTTPTATPVTARGVLLAAASASERTAETSGTVWHTRMESASVDPVVGADYLIERRWRDEDWAAPETTEPDIWERTDLGGRPTPSGTEEWKRAGSPRTWTIEGPGPCPSGSNGGVCTAELTVRDEPGEPVTERFPRDDDILYELANRSVSADDLARLPTDPDRLRAYLLKGYDGCGEACEDEPVDVEAWLFDTTSNLITIMPASPEVRAAAFRMLADLPGIRVIPDVEDPLGRPADAVAMRFDVRGGGRVENRLLVDSGTGDGLAREFYVVEPNQDEPWAEPGMRTGYEAIETTEWVDHLPGRR